MLFSLHVQHHIHNVLQHFGTGNVPRFGHMAHQEDGDVVLLGYMQQRCCTLSHLQEQNNKGMTVAIATTITTTNAMILHKANGLDKHNDNNSSQK